MHVRLGVVGGGPAPIALLKRSPWAHAHGHLDGLPDDVFLLYTQARTLPDDDDYGTCVVSALCPERSSWWWRIKREERRSDPRVCAFCAAYERERCAILGIAPPPRGVAELQIALREAQGREQKLTRHGPGALTAWDADETLADTQQVITRFEYERCRRVTTLLQMLLNAASL